MRLGYGKEKEGRGNIRVWLERKGKENGRTEDGKGEARGCETRQGKDSKGNGEERGMGGIGGEGQGMVGY